MESMNCSIGGAYAEGVVPTDEVVDSCPWSVRVVRSTTDGDLITQNRNRLDYILREDYPPQTFSL
jgi:hypothetical protein